MTTTVPPTVAATGSAAGVDTPPRTTGSRRLARLTRPEWLVFAVALVARVTVILRHGGLRGLFGYDSGVYFAGADSLVHGRLPYLDYVQLHPPAITVAVAPFALLTHVLSDSAAFTTTVLAFTVLGAVNAMLVVRVGRRLGLGTVGAVAAGVFYAGWMGAVDAEYLIKLEPLANALVLVALLLALRAERRPSRWATLVAGVPLGLAVSVKIWWIVPVLAIVVWHGRRRRSVRAGTVIAGGAALGAIVLNLPFFLAAPKQMWTMVVVDQLTRPRSIITPKARLQNLTGLTFLHLSPPVFHLLFLLFAALAVVAVAGAWRVRAARPAVGLVGLQLLVVLASPSWFPYYCDYLAVGAAIVAGAAVARVPGRAAAGRAARAGGAALLAMALAVTAAALTVAGAHVAPFPAGPQLARDVAGVRCVMSDSPAAQIRLDALSRGLADGCPNWVDVTGPTYGPYRSSAPRWRNPRWQRAFLAYLHRGQAVILVRGRASGVNAALHAAVARGGRLATVDGVVVYRTAPRP